LLVLPVPLPVTVVEVNRPVTSETPTNRSATFDVLMVVVMTSCQTPDGPTFEATQGAELVLAQTVTVLTAAAALELGAERAGSLIADGWSFWSAHPTHREPATARAAVAIRECLH